VNTPRALGFAANALLRASSAAFLLDVMRHPHDARYEGKAIPVRNLLIVGSLSLAFPALSLARHGLRQRWRAYPVWTDNLYLSIFWLDMAGNAFNLYDRHTHFDLSPHFHGSGALAAVLMRTFDWPARRTLIMANAAHALLELQEIATDRFCGTHNVRGAWDSEGDLAAGLLGTLTYVALARAAAPAHSPSR
jgi:hypothetical protein